MENRRHFELFRIGYVRRLRTTVHPIVGKKIVGDDEVLDLRHQRFSIIKFFRDIYAFQKEVIERALNVNSHYRVHPTSQSHDLVTQNNMIGETRELAGTREEEVIGLEKSKSFGLPLQSGRRCKTRESEGQRHLKSEEGPSFLEEIELHLQKVAGLSRIGGRKSILVVDNCAESRAKISSLLMKEGQAVTQAVDGFDCMQKMKDMMETGDHFDVVLMDDDDMPIVSGKQTAWRLREQGYWNPIFSITATPKNEPNNNINNEDDDNFRNTPDDLPNAYPNPADDTLDPIEQGKFNRVFDASLPKRLDIEELCTALRRTSTVSQK